MSTLLLHLLLLRIITAYPSYIACDLSSGPHDDVMTASILMDVPAITADDLISVVEPIGSTATFSEGDVLTLRLANLQRSAFIHASGGTLTSPPGWESKTDCNHGETMHFKDRADMMDSFELSWTSPENASALRTVRFSIGTALGEGTVSRQQIELLRGRPTSQPTLSPAPTLSMQPTLSIDNSTALIGTDPQYNEDDDGDHAIEETFILLFVILGIGSLFLSLFIAVLSYRWEVGKSHAANFSATESPLQQRGTGADKVPEEEDPVPVILTAEMSASVALA